MRVKQTRKIRTAILFIVMIATGFGLGWAEFTLNNNDQSSATRKVQVSQAQDLAETSNVSTSPEEGQPYSNIDSAKEEQSSSRNMSIEEWGVSIVFDQSEEFEYSHIEQEGVLPTYDSATYDSFIIPRVKTSSIDSQSCASTGMYMYRSADRPPESISYSFVGGNYYFVGGIPSNCPMGSDSDQEIHEEFLRSFDSSSVVSGD